MENSNNEAKLITKFADNGWLDWICTNCHEVIYNDDVHIHLNWKFCPLCGHRFTNAKD